MSKHTQGEWKVIEHSWSDTGIYSDKHSIALLSIEGEATEENQGALEKTMAANARLIASAPDMLEALECEEALNMPTERGYAVLERYGWDSNNRFELSATQFVLRKRKAAIAKATG